MYRHGIRNGKTMPAPLIYALGLDPNDPDATSPPRITLRRVPGTRRYNPRREMDRTCGHGAARIRDELYEEQNGQCKVCRSSGALEIDHDHDTGDIRALLCRRCNMLAGIVERHGVLFVDILRYVDRYKRHD